MAFMRWLHKWVGLIIGIPFVVLLATGTIVGAMIWWGQVTPETFGQQYEAQSNFVKGQTVDRLDELMQQQALPVTGITAPTEGSPYYRINNGATQQGFAADDLEQLYERPARNVTGFFAVVLHLHRDFLLGRQPVLLGLNGADLAAIVTLLGTVISIVGFVLWWPLRKGFRWKTTVVPRKSRRSDMFKNHIHGSTVILLPLVFLCLTGAGITYRTVTGKLLGAHDVEYNFLLEEPIITGEQWSDRIDAVARLFPDGEFVSANWPKSFRRTNGQGNEVEQQSTTRQRPQGQLADASMDKKTIRTSMQSQEITEELTLERMAQRNHEQPGRASPEVSHSQRPDLGNTIRFIFTSSADWFGVPGSVAHLDITSGDILSAYHFGELSFGQKLRRFVMPLHSGRTMPAWYTFLITVLCGWMTIVTITGVIAMLQGMKPKPKRSRNRTKGTASGILRQPAKANKLT
ncbi:PepSY-associated TM helix domain-containing protein [Ferrimonas pelagia]|uniref:PepSY domain-containing protein n=1 Tax=Ferrimonas pelagia TaxID=1177826 RepID=A0ABP9FIA9_9GAMM